MEDESLQLERKTISKKQETKLQFRLHFQPFRKK